MTILETFAAALLAAPAGADAQRIAEKLQLHLLDTKGAMIAGAASAEGRALAAGSAGALSLFGSSILDQIALSVAQTRLTEVDDIHLASCATVGSVIVPVALALTEATGASNARRDAGLLAGYDAMVRLGCAVDGARILYKGIWPTYLLAPVGAAACSAAILGLDEAKTADALAIALGQISGAAGGPAGGRNGRWLYAGWAAASGVRAALAARDGFGGDRTLLDGDWFLKTHAIAFDAGKLAGAPGGSLLEMSIKPWCTAKQASSALAGFTDLLDEGLAPADIAVMRVYVPAAYRGMIAHQPPGRIGRIVSIAWQCAVAAFHREALYDIERVDFSGDPDFAALVKKVEVLEDPALATHFPARYPARVEAETAGGVLREKTVLDAPGDPARAVSLAQVEAKFLRVCSAVLGEDKARNALEGARH